MRKLAILALSLTPAFAQTGAVTVDITPGHATNTFSPLRALGAGVDGVATGTVDNVYTATNIPQMLSAGFGPLTYRLYTELSVQDWHWNPQGTFSGPGQSGYWVSSAKSTQPIAHTHGFNLPRSGFTFDQGTSSGYSRVDDGDPNTFWKSNPYLSHAYTGDPDGNHPQWVMFDLGSKQPVNAIQIQWANPYATRYLIQYWTGPDPLYSDGDGEWITLPNGRVTGGTGGTAFIQLGPTTTNVEFVRVFMTAASGTCVETPVIDARDCMGYAVNEIGIGNINANGQFVDLVQHSSNQNNQTVTYCSSVDPWHTAALEEAGEEQAGLDLVFTSGITRGLPAVIPVTMLYGTPESAANELAYVESKGYNVGYVEMGEEPDGQFIVPEDYAALYVQWSKALHAVDPNLKLGGPVLESDYEVTAWPDASGNRSWLNRFFNYLKSHGAIDDLAFMSYEHYPYVPCEITWDSLLQEPAYTTNTLATWKADGLPPGTPIFSTETNLAYDFDAHQVTLFGALWYSDFVGVFLTQGGSQAYYYEYEPLPLYSSSDCNSWANYGMFVATPQNRIVEYDAQYFSGKILTQQWADPVDAAHYVFPAATNLVQSGSALVTAYALLRPDGQWSLLLINKDHINAHPVTVTFTNSANNSNHFFSGSVAQVAFGEQEYEWHPANAFGYAQPDGPFTTTTESGGAGTTYTLEPGSITVLRASIQ